MSQKIIATKMTTYGFSTTLTDKLSNN